ncbi:MAG: MBL fold metallo-hydrolase [Coriobacteriia bacterium]|nr:MBL fold metallo-hydrolase [Coriobacteriia bacterium]
MRVVRITVGALETNCWVVSDALGGPSVVIDPGDDAPEILRELGSGACAAVILTHAHFDHVGAVAQVLAAVDAPLLIHSSDADRLTHDAPHGTGGAAFGFAGVTAPAADRLLEDGDTIEAGALELRVLHTPGHTQGGICLFVEDPEGGAAHLFSGDTLFAGSVGRTDFPGGDSRALASSIASQLTAFEPQTIVHPGHGPDTTIGREQRINPFWPRA